MDDKEQLSLQIHERPPIVTLILLGLQFVIPNCISLIFPILIIQIVGMEANLAASFMSVTLIASAIGTFIQVKRIKGFIGGGLLLPLSAAPAYLAPSLLAIKMGGLPLMYGMTLFAGIIQGVLSFFFTKLKRFFPIEIASVVLAIIGIDLFKIGLSLYARLVNSSTPFIHNISGYSIVNLIPILLMIVLFIWGKGWFKNFYLLISVTIGYFLIYAFDGLDPARLNDIHQAHWFFLPKISGTYAFNSKLIIEFAIVAAIYSIKIFGAVGSLTAINQENNKLKEVDMKKVCQSNLADSIGTILSGLLGGMGLNASSSVIGMSLSTKILSRYIAYPISIILLIMAFCPKIALSLVAIPPGVSAGLLCFLGAQLFISSTKLLFNQMENAKQRLAMCIAFIFGLSYFIYPKTYAQFPTEVKMFSGSSIALTAVVAILLNFCFLLRLRKSK